MAVNTCAALANKSVEIPDNCGRLTKNGIRNNWLLVRSIYEWIKGFLTFTIPGFPVQYTEVLTGQDYIDIPFVDPVSSKVYSYPTDNLMYPFFEVFWNGQKIEGGTATGGMDPFTYQIQWEGANFDANNYRISFYDETGAALPMGSAELPCTVTVRFNPSLLIGSNFCTTNGSDTTNSEPCGC